MDAMKRVLESIRYLAFYQRLDFAFAILFNENPLALDRFLFLLVFRRVSPQFRNGCDFKNWIWFRTTVGIMCTNSCTLFNEANQFGM